jgi:septal ring-binding cell division protein DamX
VPDNHFAVQLIAAKNRQGIATYRQSHPDQQTIELQTVVNQDPWYILLLGIYPSQEAAKSAIKAMSPAPSADPWIRSMGPLKQSIASGQ